MFYSHGDGVWLNPALDVIRKYDPTVYREMTALDCTWHVYVTEGSYDIDWVERVDPFQWFSLMRSLPHAFGVTSMPDPRFPVVDSTERATWLNRPGIEDSAKEMDVPEVDFLADILVHEFEHSYKLHGEREAFAESTRFGLLLPAYDAPIVERSQRTLNEMVEAGEGDI